MYAELAPLGVATVYEASGRRGLVDVPLTQVVAGSRAAGPARTVRCGEGDNLMVHAAVAHARPGDVLVLTLPDPEPVALVGDLLATQAKAARRGSAARRRSGPRPDELRELGLPVWARWVRARGAEKRVVGALDEPVEVGGAVIRAGDSSCSTRTVRSSSSGSESATCSRRRATGPSASARSGRSSRSGALSYDLDGLRERVEGVT